MCLKDRPLFHAQASALACGFPVWIDSDCCGVFQGNVQVLEECHGSNSSQEQGKLTAMSLPDVAQQPSPPGGEHCTQTVITRAHAIIF